MGITLDLDDLTATFYESIHAHSRIVKNWDDIVNYALEFIRKGHHTGSASHVVIPLKRL